MKSQIVFGMANLPAILYRHCGCDETDRVEGQLIVLAQFHLDKLARRAIELGDKELLETCSLLGLVK